MGRPNRVKKSPRSLPRRRAHWQAIAVLRTRENFPAAAIAAHSPEAILLAYWGFFSRLAVIFRQRIVNGGRGSGRVRGTDCHLIQRMHDIARGVDAGDGGALMRIHPQLLELVLASAETLQKFTRGWQPIIGYTVSAKCFFQSSSSCAPPGCATRLPQDRSRSTRPCAALPAAQTPVARVAGHSGSRSNRDTRRWRAARRRRPQGQ